MENHINPIPYLAGGLLGDFIHSLSVVKEKYLESCLKVLVPAVLVGVFTLGSFRFFKTLEYLATKPVAETLHETPKLTLDNAVFQVKR